VVGIFDGYRRNGALTVLAGGAPREIHEQLVKDHPFDVLCSTQGETENDIFTGHLLGAPCFGKYKIEKVTKAICDQGLTLKEAAFYTDSYTDRPLLEAVGFPFAVNPDFRLRRLARKRGWPILEYGV
jgi:phosphoserine phosphatase